MQDDHELHCNKPQPAAASYFSTWLLALKRSPIIITQACSSLIKLTSSVYTIWVSNWWTLELLSWLSAAWALGMIILILSLHQDRPLPQWPSSITMNSLLSVLSQIGQWGLTGSVAKAIGQLKWLWFMRPKRSLNDFVAFDRASTGPWGSFLLLTRGWLMFVPPSLPRKMGSP